MRDPGLDTNSSSNKNQYFLYAVIRFHKSSTLRFKRDVNFISPSSSKIKIFSPEDNVDELKVEMTVKASTQKEAGKIGKKELKRIINRLSFLCDVAIPEGIIITIVHQTGPIPPHRYTEIGFKTQYSLIKELDTTDLNELKPSLEKSYSEDFEKTTSMWQQAISAESNTSKYFLFYRILEKLIGSKQKIDQWILSKEPEVETKKDRGRELSIFTFLRNHIHPKQADFPFDKIRDYLPQLQNLVRKAIEEKFEPLHE